MQQHGILISCRKRDEWLLQRPDPTPEQLELLDEAAEGGSGTLVIWGKVDRLINEYANPTGRHARNAFERRVRRVSDLFGVDIPEIPSW